MRYNFNDFKNTVSKCLTFETKWDDDQWNQQYINFKNWLQGISPSYLAGLSIESQYMEFAEDYYLDAKPDTHSYWLILQNKKR